MTDERNPKLDAAYRALGAEEPPRVLDDAILAAARRSAQPWTRRWALPVSVAAVVVLSVTVTLRIQHEQPDIEMPVQATKEIAKADVAVKSAAEPATQVPPQKAMTRRQAEAFPGPSRDRGVLENRATDTAPGAAPAAEAPAVAARVEAPALAKRADARSEVGSVAGSVAAPPAPAAAAPAMRAMQRDRAAAEATMAERPALTPEQELERIADLRKQGRHDDADKALVEFRKRYPDFKLTDAMRERVERR